MPPLVLLGPQRLQPCVREVLDSLAPDGSVATITAGWEERELEDDELREHCGREAFNLRLFERCERVFERDPELFAAMRERHDRLRRLAELYRLRLGHALEAARQVMAMAGDESLLEPERAAAIEIVQAVDRQHLARVHEVHASFEERLQPAQRPAVVRERHEVAGLLQRCGAVAIAGGHVVVLQNRLKLFGLGPLLGAKPLVAWSAGAMVLAEHVVLFHDAPPQGPGNAELFEEGLGLVRGILPLPHARRRLRLDDPLRVALFARRFAPAVGVPLDERDRLEREPDGSFRLERARRLSAAGTVSAAAAGAGAAP